MAAEVQKVSVFRYRVACSECGWVTVAVVRPEDAQYWMATHNRVNHPIPPEPDGDVILRDRDGIWLDRSGPGWGWNSTSWDDLVSTRGPLTVYREEK